MDCIEHVDEKGCVAQLYCGDSLAVLKTLPDMMVQTCVTSPPYYGLRDYGVNRQIGLEKTTEEYIARLVEVFREVHRVLRDDGTLWVNMGDSYAANRGYQVPDSKWDDVGNNHGSKVPAGLKPKDLIGIPWMLAFALRADGWYLRSEIIWHKPNAMPESVRDRPTKAHETFFLLSKKERYYYDAEAVKEDSVSDHPSGNGYKRDARLSYRDANGARGNDEQWQPQPKRNRRTVWTVTTKPYAEAHFATFPMDLIEPCILAGSAPGAWVLDPFCGSGTTGKVARQHGRHFIGIDLNPTYLQLSQKRMGWV